MKKLRVKDFFKLNPNYIYLNKVSYDFIPMSSLKIGGGFNVDSQISGDNASKYTHIKNNNLIMAKVTPCFENNKISIIKNLNTKIGLATTEVMVFKPKKSENLEYLFYWLSSPDFINWGVNNMVGAGGLKRVPENKVKNLFFTNFNYSQQAAIANYLDHHTAKIDKEIELLEKKLTLLDEYKQSLIYETVTKGLDKNVPLKDSGIKWIGMIPEHWEVKKLKNIADINKGDIFAEECYQDEGKYPYINGGINPSGYGNVFNAKENTIAVSEGGASSGYSQFMTTKYWAGAHCYKVVGKSLYNKYLYYILKGFNSIIAGEKTGSAMPNLQKTKFLNVMVVSTKLIAEQKEIINYLDKQCLVIDRKKELFNKKINLLKEYKQSLIYESVTGKNNLC